MARCNPVLDLIEEALDQVPSPVKIRLKQIDSLRLHRGGILAPAPLLGGECSDPIRIIATVRQQHCFRFGARREFAGKPAVRRLTGRQRVPDPQAVGVDQPISLNGTTLR